MNKEEKAMLVISSLVIDDSNWDIRRDSDDIISFWYKRFLNRKEVMDHEDGRFWKRFFKIEPIYHNERVEIFWCDEHNEWESRPCIENRYRSRIY